MREMVISVLYDVSMDRRVRLADLDACGAVGCLLGTLSTGSLRPQATLLALELLKKLTRTFSLDMVDRVLARDGPRVVGGLVAAALRGDGDEDEDARVNAVFSSLSSGQAEDTLSERDEVVSRSLLLLCRWAALSPSRLDGTFETFWEVLLYASRAQGAPSLFNSRDPSGSSGSSVGQQRHLAYAFCGVCVLSIGDASKLARLCVELEDNMRAVCAGLDAYHDRFPCDRLPRAVVTAMMTLRGHALVGRALQVDGMSFLRASGEMAGATILRGAWSPDGGALQGLADFVATSVGAAGVFHADTDADTRKRIVCELLEDEMCGGVEFFQGCPTTRGCERRADEFETDDPDASYLRKETSMDSIVLDTLCRDSKGRTMGGEGETRKSGGKRGLELISEAYSAAKRARRRPDNDGDDCGDDCGDDALRRDPLTIRIGGSTAIAVEDRRRLADLVGVVSLFEDDGSEILDLPGALPGTVPDGDRFARACTEVLRFLNGRGAGTQVFTSTKDQGDAFDCWIVADYLGVSCDRLHAALFGASTAETIERLLLRFLHLAPTVAKCAWRRYGECGPRSVGRKLGRGSHVSSLLIERVYDHLCEILVD